VFHFYCEVARSQIGLEADTLRRMSYLYRGGNVLSLSNLINSATTHGGTSIIIRRSLRERERRRAVCWIYRRKKILWAKISNSSTVVRRRGAARRTPASHRRRRFLCCAADAAITAPTHWQLYCILENALVPDYAPIYDIHPKPCDCHICGGNVSFPLSLKHVS